MATLPYSMTSLNAIIADTVPQKVDHAVRQESMLWDLANKSALMNGKGVDWRPILTSNQSVATYTPGGAVPAGGAFGDAEASMTTGSYVGALTLTHKQLEQIDLSERMGQMKLAGFIQEQMADIAREFATKFHTDIISGAGPSSNAMLGLTGGSGYWIDDAGTVAGINRSTYANWACYMATDTSTRVLTLDIMDAAVNTYRNTITTAGAWSSGNWAILAPSGYVQLMRGFSASNTNFNAGADTQAQKLIGYADVQYRNIPVLDVPGYTAARIDFIRLADFHVKYLPGKNADGSLNGTPFIMQPVQIDGANYTWRIFAYPLTQLRNPRHSAFSIEQLKLS